MSPRAHLLRASSYCAFLVSRSLSLGGVGVGSLTGSGFAVTASLLVVLGCFACFGCFGMKATSSGFRPWDAAAARPIAWAWSMVSSFSVFIVSWPRQR